MAVSIDYAVRETAGNLWRNRLMTIAAILTVAVSLALVGAALLLNQGVQIATARWRGGVNLAIFFDTNVSGSQQQAVGRELRNDPDVKSYFYMDPQRSFEEAKTILKDEPDLESTFTSPSQVPTSYRVTLRDANYASTVADQFRNQPGVYDVRYPGQDIKTMVNVTDTLKIIFFSIALILLVSALVLILNTIRLGIFARRREVAVMKLVGATNWFIRVPFMLEGLVQGVVGGLVACLIVLGLNQLLSYSVRHDHVSLLSRIVVPASDVQMTQIVLLVVGSVVGAVGSYFAVRRHLEV